ncbi:MAG: hypothetical protein IJS32_00540 [Kiritimatiellae bacterium]|nr:hypothetical protein [Kiritimatiellia bacterium]
MAQSAAAKSLPYFVSKPGYCAAHSGGMAMALGVLTSAMTFTMPVAFVPGVTASLGMLCVT